MHLELIFDRVVVTVSDEAKKWTNSSGNYTFKQVGNHTGLTIEIQIEPDYKGMYENRWPLALDTLKKSGEKQT